VLCDIATDAMLTSASARICYQPRVHLDTHFRHSRSLEKAHPIHESTWTRSYACWQQACFHLEFAAAIGRHTWDVLMLKQFVIIL